MTLNNSSLFFQNASFQNHEGRLVVEDGFLLVIGECTRTNTDNQNGVNRSSLSGLQVIQHNPRWMEVARPNG